MRKQRIYLDTSVISHLYAPDTPEKMADTLRLWNLLETGKYDIVISEAVTIELERCAEFKRQLLADFMQRIQYVEVESNNDSVVLASKFIDFGILKEKSFDDCRHIAAALVSGCDIIVSWNFRHIVNPDTIVGVRKIAIAGGFQDIIICTPSMLTKGGLDYE